MVLAVFALLRHYLPSRPAQTTTQENIAELDSKFRTAQWFVSISLVFTGTILGIALYQILFALNQHYADAEGTARFQLLPSRAIWLFLPVFAALSLSWEIVRALWERFGNHDFLVKYVDWIHAKAGFDSTRVLRWMALLITLPIAIATLLAVPIHSTLRTPCPRLFVIEFKGVAIHRRLPSVRGRGIQKSRWLRQSDLK